MLDQVGALSDDAPVRLGKRTSNLFRQRTSTDTTRLDVSDLTHVIAIDVDARTAHVQGMTTYEDLVDATLAHGLMPLVVPQLRTITIGGAVTGLGIESSSFRSGLPHESVLEMEILTGDGEVVVATPDGAHAELFRTFPNSYGSLGYAVSLIIELEAVHPFVVLRHVRFDRVEALTDAVAAIAAERVWAGEPVDFLDGVVFSRHEAYLTLGTWADTLDAAEQPSDYTGQQVFYRSIRERDRDVLTVHDYLWRWDTDWFWCSRAFGAQHPLVRRLWPRNKLRSDVYWKLVAFENQHQVMSRIDAYRGRPARERVVQDVEIPLGRTAEFLDWFLREVPIEPVWVCPIRLRSTTLEPWPLYPMDPGELYVNVGFWSTVPIEHDKKDGDVNRVIEDQVGRFGGHKSLYSDAYYDEPSFDRLYGGDDYRPVKKRYDPRGRLPTLYDKAVRRR
ncbi:MAG: FAD-binding oxidoreductase [Actinomycetota bacterium]|nr:FAD-binding oxidoreductase [Actinomycetota bacterium]